MRSDLCKDSNRIEVEKYFRAQRKKLVECYSASKHIRLSDKRESYTDARNTFTRETVKGYIGIEEGTKPMFKSEKIYRDGVLFIDRVFDINGSLMQEDYYNAEGGLICSFFYSCGKIDFEYFVEEDITNFY